MTFAPLTGSVLAAAADELAGTVSGVNVAVARTAGLMAVAATLARAYRAGLLISAAAMAAGAALTALGLPPTAEPAVAME